MPSEIDGHPRASPILSIGPWRLILHAKDAQRTYRASPILSIGPWRGCRHIYTRSDTECIAALRSAEHVELPPATLDAIARPRGMPLARMRWTQLYGE